MAGVHPRGPMPFQYRHQPEQLAQRRPIASESQLLDATATLCRSGQLIKPISIHSPLDPSTDRRVIRSPSEPVRAQPSAPLRGTFSKALAAATRSSCRNLARDTSLASKRSPSLARRIGVSSFNTAQLAPRTTSPPQAGPPGAERQPRGLSAANWPLQAGPNRAGKRGGQDWHEPGLFGRAGRAGFGRADVTVLAFEGPGGKGGRAGEDGRPSWGGGGGGAGGA